MQKHILSIDDEPRISTILQTVLSMKGFRVSIASTADAARRILQSDPPDLIIMDQQLEDTDGLTLAEEIWKTMPSMPILLLTGLIFDNEVIEEIRGKRVTSYLPKTTKLDIISKEVNRLLGEAAKI
ncbi:MAG: response regulator [bacterium]|jgi:DNA-binding response OmpR family regulator